MLGWLLEVIAGVANSKALMVCSDALVILVPLKDR
jgi:hypothetical protein